MSKFFKGNENPKIKSGGNSTQPIVEVVIEKPIILSEVENNNSGNG